MDKLKGYYALLLDFFLNLYYNIYIERKEAKVASDAHLFKLAREVSFDATYCGSARIGAIAVYKGSVLAKGCNSDKTHTAQAHFNVHRFKESGNKYLPSKLHAEITVLQKIKYLDIDFSRVHIYIYRELKNGKIAMARPCEACMAAICDLGIRYIHYSTDCGFAYEKLLIKGKRQNNDW